MWKLREEREAEGCIALTKRELCSSLPIRSTPRAAIGRQQKREPFGSLSCQNDAIMPRRSGAVLPGLRQGETMVCSQHINIHPGYTFSSAYDSNYKGFTLESNSVRALPAYCRNGLRGSLHRSGLDVVDLVQVVAGRGQGRPREPVPRMTNFLCPAFAGHFFWL